jgi:aryl-alcohol dehydrogenase-like predicted oxidoreductase
VGTGVRIQIADGLEVRRPGFGGLHLSGPGIWGPPADPAAARELLHRAIELGVDFIDTADTYGGSEEAIAGALHPYPDGLVIATKGGLDRDGPELDGYTQWPYNGRPEALKRACEQSLGRLRLDCIELYMLHGADPDVPIEESMGALNVLQAEGKIRHIGVSNVTTGELEAALATSRVVAVQNNYSVGDREHEAVLGLCERTGVAFIPWYPLGGGELAADRSTLAAVARRHGMSITQVAIAWLLQRSPRLLPIPGTTSVAHLQENLAAAELELEPDDVAELDALA